MNKTSLPLLLLAAAAGCGPTRIDTTPAPTPAWSALETAIRQRISQEAPAEVAVSVVDLGSGRRLGINDTVTMHAASTMKVPVLIELFRQAGRGRFSLDDRIPVVNRFTSIADGSSYALSPGDDSDSAVYAMVGKRIPIRELATHMIDRSSNLATNNLIALVTPDSVQKTMKAIGAEKMRVLRGVEDIPAFRAGMNNVTTARALGRTLEAIARCQVTTRPACNEMVRILEGQEFNDMIPAGLPPGTPVAHKTGWITGIKHDGAIVYPPGRDPYVLVIMTRGFEDTLRASRTGADISRMVWQALVQPEATTAAQRAGATPTAGRPGFSGPEAATAAAMDALYPRYRVPGITTRRFTHDEYWGIVGPLVDSSKVLRREEVGRSAEGRTIYAVTYGHGPRSALLWSQMHGDESTATMALADIFHFLDAEPDDPVARRIADQVTVTFIPMLNPDGAERFQRRDALGIDVNRDARRLSTPEAQTLKRVRDRLEPDFGFNLHDQNVRTRVGSGDSTVAIALLAPRPDTTNVMTPGFLRAQHLAAAVYGAIDPLVGGHIARYDDTHNPRAFGDMIQHWGASTILIESGGWKNDPEKQYLRRTNFVAILSALDAIATGSYDRADLAVYRGLPENGRSVADLLILGGKVALAGMTPYPADVAVNYAEPLHQEGGRITDVGDLAEMDARDTLRADGLYIFPQEHGAQAKELGTGRPATFVLRRGPDATSAVVWTMDGGAPKAAAAGADGGKE